MSWPDPALTSAAARAGSSRCGMWSTVTAIPFFFPQSRAKPSIQRSYSGIKWLHCRIFRVFVSADAVETNGADTVGARPAAPAAIPMVLRKSRRVEARLDLLRERDDMVGLPGYCA